MRYTRLTTPTFLAALLCACGGAKEISISGDVVVGEAVEVWLHSEPGAEAFESCSVWEAIEVKSPNRVIVIGQNQIDRHSWPCWLIVELADGKVISYHHDVGER